jgi:4-hydroxybenzoate polyprenyltransferase
MNIFRLYRYVNLLSLDIVAGAIICALFFAQVFSVEVLPVGVLLLAVVVWIIYTADHLLDAHRLKSEASTNRHIFHQQFFKPLLLVWILFVCVGVVLLFFIRIQVFKSGVIIFVLVLLYLLTNRYLRFLKEFIGAWLYTMGVLTLSLSMAIEELQKQHVMLIFQFFLTAFFNLILFSWFDRESDRKDQHTSFVLHFGERATRYFLISLMCIQALLVFIQVSWSGLFWEATVIASMQAFLFLLMLMHKCFSKADLFRLIGDAVFFIPLIYLVWGNV